ncbi:restriction endonuclease [Cronobacter sakazakii]|uniref:restriction endonuclease n=1 Tax=Cronobacter sakazakii TaxID=28141 RepID=UPI001F6168BD|nr:restriction endonuclease [Cronobacter sakazakii]MCZ6132150.1 restriction endonuclease [Cronobacter sakazakii]MCZ6139927.1 restriction endonuclease [Cronobacter sakazakii]
MIPNAILDMLILAGFILAAYFLFFKKRNRHERKKSSAKRIIKVVNGLTHPGQKIAYLRKTDPYAFEELILTLLQRKGFVIARNKRYSGDGGIDGKFVFNGKTWLIQAKRYSSRIRIEHVVAFARILDEHKCNGIFVHTGLTPVSVVNYVKSMKQIRLEIISGEKLLSLFDSEKKGTF